MQRSTAHLVAIFIGMDLLAAACGSSRSDPTNRRRANLDVLLITIDTLRADAVGAYGNRRSSTPSIDRLAAAGVRFAEAHAHNVTTLASHANLLSGRYPTDHGVRDNSGFRFPADVDTLATLLKAQGYRTGAFISAYPLDSRFGLDRGFDVYDHSFVDAQPRPAFLEQERRGAETVALATKWLDAGAKSQPYFCWVHLYEPHFPYTPPEPFASRFPSDPYLGEVAAADAAIAPIIEYTRDGRRPLVVLTGDHGESLGEHGEATHGIFAYEATLSVPLIVFQPELFAPGVVGQPARHVDVLPTILDALTIRAPDGLPGRSLLPLVSGVSSDDAYGNASAAPMYFEALSGNLNRGWAPLHGLIRDRIKYIDLPIPELYDLQRDAREQHNLAASQPQRVDDMRRLLDAIGASAHPQERRPETADARERLRSLGYAGAAAAPAARYTEADDPKRLIDLDTLLQDVLRLYLAGDLRTAIIRCRELVDRRPTMAVSLIELGHLERESGNLPAAIDALHRAAALTPDDTQTISLLGAYLTQAGRAREAVDLLEPYSRREPPDPQLLTSRALALATVGRTSDALAELGRARAHDPNSAMLRVDSGTVYLMAGDRAHAREEFEAALSLNPDVARAHSSLGIMAAEEGRTDEAIAHWRDALHADPREAGKLIAFADFLRQRGRNNEAHRYLELVAGIKSPPAGR